MRHNVDYTRRIFKGAGFLLGFIVGAFTGILTVAITGVNGIIGAVSAAVSIPAGFYLEKKLQRKQTDHNKEGRKFYSLLLILGAVLFVSNYFFIRIVTFSI